MAYLLRYGDIEFAGNFAQVLKYIIIIQINRQTVLCMKCLRVYSEDVFVTDISIFVISTKD